MKKILFMLLVLVVLVAVSYFFRGNMPSIKLIPFFMGIVFVWLMCRVNKNKNCN